ncbi:transposase [uncultured Paludibaculum sp.]|uniref:transposase n=1 Tax=uncultured Paludibaculum sp. TaxID=1765020 RepID=UPI002AAAE611|nr:transposase [uncultured Paludibaculum sp.]
MSLLSEFLAITADWRPVFPQQRTFVRGVRQALGSLICLGRRCLTRILWTNGGQHSSWSAEYFLHSRCQWEPQELFRPILKSALAYCPQRLVGVALDDTKLRKTGRSIQQAFYQRDPMSPPFHLNLVLGLRFLQASLLVPLHRNAPVGSRALPIRFQEVSRVKRPGKKASDAEKKQYREAVKTKNLSRSFVEMGKQLRQELDKVGGNKKILVLTADGSFCNRTCFGEIPERSALLARARKDAKLCFHAEVGSRRFYGAEKFTPEQVRKDEGRQWKTTKIFYGGKRRTIRYKEVADVYWQRGAGKRPLRLIVVAPTPYRKSQSKKLYYRDPAYLLTSDLRNSAKQLLQIYFDRWQIEVNHREEKDTLGVGQAQLWNVTSVPKQPVLAVAAYSALLLASLRAFGVERGSAYAELPKWRRNARRPSCLDLVTLLRKEMVQQPNLLEPFAFEVTEPGMVRAAAA